VFSYLKLSVFQQFRRLFIAFMILPGGIDIIITMVCYRSVLQLHQLSACLCITPFDAGAALAQSSLGN
jgi:hypothetical protein